MPITTSGHRQTLCVPACRLAHAAPQDNAKNYQLWNHRRKCALRAGPAVAERELDFATQALNIDEKNYHAWAHRLAVVQVGVQGRRAVCPA